MHSLLSTNGKNIPCSIRYYTPIFAQILTVIPYKNLWASIEREIEFDTKITLNPDLRHWFS
ncbi:hypothetical protein DESC_250010 [Desulfosarcina cetonica]|nr:hypothetical protein DESC_250010 [Desulfosarcina cetonica]